MSNHFSAANLKHPGDDARLDLTDLFVFAAPGNPDRTVLIMDSNPFTKGDGFHPDAVYRFNIDNDGDALADVAFVGGGFHRAGLHSVLEPAVFGAPVTVGPHWHMSRDAALLIERGGAVALSADGRHPLHSQWLVWHHDPAARSKAGAAGKRLVREGRGAAERTTALVKKLVAG